MEGTRICRRWTRVFCWTYQGAMRSMTGTAVFAIKMEPAAPPLPAWCALALTKTSSTPTTPRSGGLSSTGRLCVGATQMTRALRNTAIPPVPPASVRATWLPLRSPLGWAARRAPSYSRESAQQMERRRGEALVEVVRLAGVRWCSRRRQKLCVRPWLRQRGRCTASVRGLGSRISTRASSRRHSRGRRRGSVARRRRRRPTPRSRRARSAGTTRWRRTR
mmetsp:Transcript_5394/g.14088  ORF Transcript_5394/g.14088 Transcript_5394/m.14088 type:complete len:220 (-) Transcript_5394:334-993(-)